MKVIYMKKGIYVKKRKNLFSLLSIEEFQGIAEIQNRIMLNSFAPLYGILFITSFFLF